MTPGTLLVSALLLSSLIDDSFSARILFLYPFKTSSHYGAFFPIIEELAKRGHQITAYTAIKSPTELPNYEEHLITLDVENSGLAVPWKFTNPIYYINWIRDYFEPIIEKFLQSKEIQGLMQSENEFDLIILEATFNQECLLAFSHKFDAPVINLNALYLSPWVAQLAGQPHSFSYIPDFRTPHSDQMTFRQRLVNTGVGMYEILVGHLYHLPAHESLMKRFFKYPGSETLPPLRELIRNISLHLVDSHPLLNSVRPYSSNVVDVAGLNIKPVGKLPQDIQIFMDEATDGVIYFALGSFIDSSLFTDQVTKMLIEAMKSLKQRVIWKWDQNIEDTTNILTRSWLPQAEILAHPNCKLFITHGGYNSLVQAMSIGIPVLGMPFISDQYHDFAFYEQQGVGLEVDFFSITSSQLSEKINRVIQSRSYRENAKKLSTWFHNVPQTSMEKAIFWVEYVMRHNGAHHLKPASVKMPYYRYLLIDVLLFIMISSSLVIFICFKFLCNVVSLCQWLELKLTNGGTKNKRVD